MSEAKPKCGIVRPIGVMDGYPPEHWAEVHEIIIDSLKADFSCRLVSDADEIGIIQGRIVQNLYSDELVICDVSGKNANVMFELGMRLAFDKPTIVMKDDVTTYSFDTSPIEHLGYPHDLRFGAIVEFKEKLARKAIATVEAPKRPEYKSFLQHFGRITVANLEQREVPAQQYILEELRELKAAVSHLLSYSARQGESSLLKLSSRNIAVPRLTEKQLDLLMAEARMLPGVRSVAGIPLDEDKTLLTIRRDPHDGIMREDAFASVVEMAEMIRDGA